MRSEKEIKNRIRDIENMQIMLKQFEPRIDSLQLHARKWELIWVLGKVMNEHGVIKEVN